MTATHQGLIKTSGNDPVKGTTFFQPKLSINTPGDTYEQEADAMADKVMRMKDTHKTDTFFKPAISHIQRTAYNSDGPGPGHPTPYTPNAAPTTKNVSVDFVKLRGSSRTPSSDLTFANTVFNPCKVQFTIGTNAVATDADSNTWLGGDTTLSRIDSCSNTHAEERALLAGATSKFSLSSRLVVFYMDKMDPADRGLSFPPFCASGARAPFVNHAYIANEAQSRSLAHEFGHILLNSGVHPADTNNLMHPTNDSTGEQLTPAQCTTIFSNA